MLSDITLVDGTLVLIKSNLLQQNCMKSTLCIQIRMRVAALVLSLLLFKLALYACAMSVAEVVGLKSKTKRFPVCPLSTNPACLRIELPSVVAPIE